VIELPGRLERSTLGDVLGALHRGRVTGSLSLDDGRCRHLVHWREGLIEDIESPVPPAATGPEHSASRSADDPRARRLRLEALFELEAAQLRFRARAGARPRPEPLAPPDFLYGRQRQRDRLETHRDTTPSDERERALQTLGLSEQQGPAELRTRFLTLARRWHPDRHPHVGERTRAALCRRFSAIVAAYETLTHPPASPR
jgi:hypothetical protein